MQNDHRLINQNKSCRDWYIRKVSLMHKCLPLPRYLVLKDRVPHWRFVVWHPFIVLVSHPELIVQGTFFFEPTMEIGENFVSPLLGVCHSNTAFNFSPVEVPVAFIPLVHLEMRPEVVTGIVRTTNCLVARAKHAGERPKGAVHAQMPF